MCTKIKQDKSVPSHRRGRFTISESLPSWQRGFCLYGLQEWGWGCPFVSIFELEYKIFSLNYFCINEKRQRERLFPYAFRKRHFSLAGPRTSGHRALGNVCKAEAVIREGRPRSGQQGVWKDLERWQHAWPCKVNLMRQRFRALQS